MLLLAPPFAPPPPRDGGALAIRLPRPGHIGMAVMSADGTITLTLHTPDGAEGVLAYKKSDPQYARIFSHIGGIRPGEHKLVPAFC